MATEVDRLFHLIEPLVPVEANGTRVSPAPARGKAAAMVIATRNEIVAVGIEALLQADGYRVVARCSSEDDLLRCSEACRPDIIVLAENIVRQETAKIILRLRDHNRSVAIVFLLEERNATHRGPAGSSRRGNSVEDGVRQELHRLCRERASRPEVGRPRLIERSEDGGMAPTDCEHPDVARS
jgi:hypothetical protein